jgi:anthranilate phosphoribosyltransferase
VRALLAGEQGPRRDVVLLNAGATLEIAGRAPSLAEGVALAAATIDSGEAAAALERWVGASRTR